MPSVQPVIRKRYIPKDRRERLAERPARYHVRESDPKTDWETLRPLVLAKFHGCYLCTRPLTLEEMTSDHVTIQPRGCKKVDALENLMPACFECNTVRKGSRRLTEIPCQVCGHEYQVKGLCCLKCERGTSVTRRSRYEI